MQFLSENHIAELSFGEVKEIYEMTQKTFGFGLSYVSGPNLTSINYYQSSADNVLFDPRINARYDENNKDQAVDFNTENAIFLVKESSEFDDWLNGMVSDIDTFRN